MSLLAFVAIVVLAHAGLARAGSVSLAGGTLLYEAAAGETNRVFVVDSSAGFSIIDLGASVTTGAGCTSVNASEAFCPLPPRDPRIHVVAGDMDDYVLLNSFLYSTSRLEGGDGADELEGSLFGTDVLDGGAGPDIFHGLPTFDRDRVDYSSRINPVTVTVGDGLANDGEAGEGDRIDRDITFVVGGQAGDTLSCLIGNRSTDEFDAAQFGRGGNDHLTSTCNFADLYGGDGNDTLRAIRPFSSLVGGFGDDILTGGPFRQVLSGGEGRDRIDGKRGGDRLDGGPGADRLVGGAGRDGIFGGLGPDTLFSRDGERDRVRGGLGRDRARIDRLLDVVQGIESFF